MTFPRTSCCSNGIMLVEPEESSGCLSKMYIHQSDGKFQGSVILVKLLSNHDINMLRYHLSCQGQVVETVMPYQERNSDCFSMDLGRVFEKAQESVVGRVLILILIQWTLPLYKHLLVSMCGTCSYDEQ